LTNQLRCKFLLNTITNTGLNLVLVWNKPEIKSSRRPLLWPC